MLWLQIIIPLVTLLIALLTIRNDVKRKRGQILIPTLLVFTTIAVCVVSYAKDVEIRKDKAESDAAQQAAELKRAKAQSQLDRIEGRVGSDEMAKRYLETMRRITQEYAAVNTASAVDRFFNTENQRRDLRVQESRAYEKAKTEFTLQVQPIVDLVLAKIDAWAVGVRRKGIAVDVRETNQALTKFGMPQSGDTLRMLKFPNDAYLNLILFPAVIEGGKIVRNMRIQAQFYLDPSGGNPVWMLDSIESTAGIAIQNPWPSRLSYQDFLTRSANPSADPELLRAISESLDATMTFVINEGAKELKDRRATP